MKGIRSIGIWIAGIGAIGYLAQYLVAALKPYGHIMGLVVVGGVILVIVSYVL